MTTVDIKDPEIMRRLKEKFKNELGKDLTEEEILEKCLNFSMLHISQLISENETKNKDPAVSNTSSKEENNIFVISDILEDEYEKIKKSGKTIKQVIRESWKY